MAAPDALLHKLPPMYLFAAGLDPLLDDSIQFARRLRNLGKAVRLEIFKEVSDCDSLTPLERQWGKD